MKTFETTGIVMATGAMTVTVPETLRPGAYRVVVVVDTQAEALATPSSAQPIALPCWPWDAWPPDSTFRREELYGDDGR
jgi:hypothetical protein